MSNYILSIVIPTYNTEAYLQRCIESLIDDRINGKVQIIIVNDGSKDGSLELAHKLAHGKEYIEVIDKPNGGHGSTINKGVEISSGKYFRVLDSDDWFETEQFVKYVDDLERIDSDLVLTWGYWDRVYEKKQYPYTMFSDDSFIEYGKEYRFEELDMQGKYFLMAHITYKTDVIKADYKPLQENTFYVDNEYLLYPMKNVSTITFLNYFIYHYFIGRPEQSVSRTTIKRNVEHVKRVSFEIIDFYSKTKGCAGNAFDTYAKDVAMHITRTYYNYLLFYYFCACKTLKSFDREIKELSIDIYDYLNKVPHVKMYRRFPYIFPCVSQVIFTIQSWFVKNK